GLYVAVLWAGCSLARWRDPPETKEKRPQKRGPRLTELPGTSRRQSAGRRAPSRARSRFPGRRESGWCPRSIVRSQSLKAVAFVLLAAGNVSHSSRDHL